MHLATPRTLLFLERDGLWLFLLGAPSKWFAGRLNGLGGSVEPGEGVLAAAHRECVEETGLASSSLRLVAVVHTIEEPPVLIFVCVGTLAAGELQPTDEGEHVWLPAAALADADRPFVPDLRTLFPRVTERAAGEPPLAFTLRPPDDLRADAPGALFSRALGTTDREADANGEDRAMNVTPMTLRHCQEVTITTGLVGPGNVTIDVPAPGSGNINVAGPGGAPIHGAVPVPSGGPRSVLVPDTAVLVLHYIRGPGGTDSVDVDVAVSLV